MLLNLFKHGLTNAPNASNVQFRYYSSLFALSSLRAFWYISSHEFGSVRG
jgi:hypothetical protein